MHENMQQPHQVLAPNIPAGFHDMQNIPFVTSCVEFSFPAQFMHENMQQPHQNIPAGFHGMAGMGTGMMGEYSGQPPMMPGFNPQPSTLNPQPSNLNPEP